MWGCGGKNLSCLLNQIIQLTFVSWKFEPHIKCNCGLWVYYNFFAKFEISHAFETWYTRCGTEFWFFFLFTVCSVWKNMQHQILSFCKSRNSDWKHKTWWFSNISIAHCTMTIMSTFFHKFHECIKQQKSLALIWQVSKTSAKNVRCNKYSPWFQFMNSVSLVLLQNFCQSTC